MNPAVWVGFGLCAGAATGILFPRLPQALPILAVIGSAAAVVIIRIAQLNRARNARIIDRRLDVLTERVNIEQNLRSRTRESSDRPGVGPSSGNAPPE